MSEVNLIHIIGAGHLGGALISGLLSSNHPKDQLLVTDHNRNRTDLITEQLGVKSYRGQKVDVTILAIKPDQLQNLSLPSGYRTNLIISVMAGVNIATLKQKFPSQPIVRAMPNLAAFYGQSATCILAISDQESLKTAFALFEKLGDVISIDTEDKMHLATAIVGSGPAFWLKLMEAFMTIEDEATKDMVIASCKSALCLAEKTQDSLSSIAKSIASPQGTTEKGLSFMEKLKIPEHIRDVILATEKRSLQIEHKSSKS